MKIKQKGRNDAGNDNAKGSRKYFEHIVGVLDDRGYNETTHGLHCDDGPNNARVTAQEALLSHGRRVLDVHSHVSNQDRRQSHLDVANPEGSTTAFEDFFCVGRDTEIERTV